MGPSGSGKSSFLNAVSGKATYGRTNGELVVNGSRSCALGDLASLIGFVPQDDVMLPELTVKENLCLYALLRRKRTFRQAEARASDVIRELDLYHVRHSPVGDASKRGISGGQKKRVNIGMELVASPRLLFLDEPTSGLDSTTSFDLVKMLRLSAENGGLNIVAVLHQPSFQTYELFHDLLLLGRGGRTVYLGPTERALEYFYGLGFDSPDRVNPADFFLDCTSGNVAHRDNRMDVDVNALWATEGVEIVDSNTSDVVLTDVAGLLDAAALSAPSGFAQAFLVFGARHMLQWTKKGDALLFDAVLHLVAGAVVGTVFEHVPLNKITQLNVMLTLASGLTTALSSLRVFGAERVVFWREASPVSGMSLDRVAYFAAKATVELLRIAVLSGMLLAMFVPLSTPQIPTVELYLATLFASYYMSGVAYALSIGLGESQAQLMSVVLVLVFTLYAGVLTTLPRLDPMSLTMSYASPGRWYAELVFVGEAQMASPLFWQPASCLEKPTDSALAQMMELGYDITAVPLNYLVLFAWGTFARLVSCVLLAVANREKMGRRSLAAVCSDWLRAWRSKPPTPGDDGQVGAELVTTTANPISG